MQFWRTVLSLFLIFTHLEGIDLIEENIHPVVVLGGGMGALTASIYLERAGIHTLVLEGGSPGGAIVQSSGVGNWPGESIITGKDLAEKIRSHAEGCGASILSLEAIQVNFDKYPYEILTRSVDGCGPQQLIKAYTVLIATGTTPKFLNVPGESSFLYQGIYTCATCDGALYKGKDVAVIGGGDSAIVDANYLKNIAKHVYVIVRKGELSSKESGMIANLKKQPNVTFIYNTTVQEIQGEEKVRSLLLQSTHGAHSSLDVSAVFLAIGATPNSQLFQNQIVLDQAGYISLKDGQKTSREHVYAIGDVCNPLYKQAIAAAGDGAKASMQIEQNIHHIPKNTQKVDVNSQEALQATPMTVHSPTPLMSLEKQTGEVLTISKSQDLDSILSNNHLVKILYFYSPHCPPCRKTSPLIEEAAKPLEGKAVVIKINVLESEELVSKYNVLSMPTMFVIPKGAGQPQSKHTGLKQIQKKLEALKQELS